MNTIYSQGVFKEIFILAGNRECMCRIQHVGIFQLGECTVEKMVVQSCAVVRCGTFTSHYNSNLHVKDKTS